MKFAAVITLAISVVAVSADPAATTRVRPSGIPGTVSARTSAATSAKPTSVATSGTGTGTGTQGTGTGTGTNSVYGTSTGTSTGASSSGTNAAPGGSTKSGAAVVGFTVDTGLAMGAAAGVIAALF